MYLNYGLPLFGLGPKCEGNYRLAQQYWSTSNRRVLCFGVFDFPRSQATREVVSIVSERLFHFIVSCKPIS